MDRSSESAGGVAPSPGANQPNVAATANLNNSVIALRYVNHAVCNIPFLSVYAVCMHLMIDKTSHCL